MAKANDLPIVRKAFQEQDLCRFTTVEKRGESPLFLTHDR